MKDLCSFFPIFINPCFLYLTERDGVRIPTLLTKAEQKSLLTLNLKSFQKNYHKYL